MICLFRILLNPLTACKSLTLLPPIEAQGGLIIKLMIWPSVLSFAQLRRHVFLNLFLSSHWVNALQLLNHYVTPVCLKLSQASYLCYYVRTVTRGLLSVANMLISGYLGLVCISGHVSTYLPSSGLQHEDTRDRSHCWPRNSVVISGTSLMTRIGESYAAD